MRQLPPGQQDAMIAGEAFQPYIRPQPDDLPFITPTRVRFAQTDPHPQLDFRQHGRIISHVIIPKLRDGEE